MDKKVPADHGLTLDYAQITDVGGRQINQDSLASAEREDLACFVMSDGAGGHVGGEVASHVIIEAVIDSFLAELSFGQRALRYYVDHAVAEVASGKAKDPRLQEMSATVAAVLIDKKNRYALWAHLGDTRIYLFRGGRVLFCTCDHSLLQQFVAAGYYPREALRTHPTRGVLYAAVGAEGDTIPEVSKENTALRSGDAILLCTDGFWEWISESQMEETLLASDSVAKWLENMRDIVENNGKQSPKLRDNYTAQALWFSESDSAI